MAEDGSPGLVVLDLDGTIVRLAVDWGALRDELGRAAARAGIVPEGPGIAALTAAAARSGDAGRALLDRLAAAELAGAEVCVVDPRVAGAARAIARTCPLAVCSSNSRHAVLRALDRAGLSGEVTRVVAREDVAAPKPDPEGLMLLASGAGIDPGELLMIGDAPADREAARRAGAAFLPVQDLVALAEGAA